MRRLSYLFNLLLAFVFLAATPLFAAEKPDIISHTAQFLDRALHVTLQWQSTNPVTLVRISAGREAKEVKVDEYDNRRVPGGYTGEVTVNIPVDAVLYQKDVAYVLQLEDDLRLKSELVTGKALLLAMSSPYGQMGHGQQDTWGQDHLKPTPKSQGGAGDLVDKLMELKDKFDLAPSITQIKSNVTGPNNVSFSLKANDDKQLREINIKVFDAAGTMVQAQQLTGLGRVWEGTSQVFNLSGGTYRVTAQALDMTGNTSKEVTASFVLKGGPITVDQPPTIPTTPPVDQPTTPPVTPPVGYPPVTTPATPATPTPPTVPPVEQPVVVPPTTPDPPVVITPPVAPSCPAGQTLCAGQCVDLSSSTQNCGACGRACPYNQSCTNGVCALVCPAGQTNCSGQCVDVKSNAQNCGACGRACPQGQTCVNSVCTLVCPTGQTNCGGQCVDVRTNVQNCGACGRACPQGQTCVNAICTASIIAGPVTPSVPVGELLQNGDFSRGASGWTYETWYQQVSPAGEVNFGQPRLTFKGTAGNSRVGVMQPINKDISGCRSLMLKAVIRADQQTLSGTGYGGREAPVSVFAGYQDMNGVERTQNGSLANPVEPQTRQLFWNGFYYMDPTGLSTPARGTKVQQGQWYSYVVDLMQQSPKPKIIRFVGAEGAGWPTRSGALHQISLTCNGDATPLFISGAPAGPTTTTPTTTSGMQPLQPPTDPVIYTNGNIAGVQNGPRTATTFSITAPHKVTWIYTYHYFNGGKLPGTISLRHSDGTVYGPFKADGAVGQGNVPNAYWFVRPNEAIKPGSYTVVDSDTATWSHNSGSNYAGFVELRGIKGAEPTGMQPLSPPTDPVIYSNGNIAGVQNGPRTATTFSITAPHQVTWIYTYHYFNSGKLPGTISLRHSDGTVYGPFRADGAVGQGNVPNAYWFVRPDVAIKPGSYTVIDSDPTTWSHNSGSNFAGFVELRGRKGAEPATSGMQLLQPPSDPVIYTNGNIAGVQNGPRTATTFNVTTSQKITWIYTYHYFNNGKLPGTISLRHSDGTVYGPFQTNGAVGQGNVPNAYWWVKPNVVIKPGSYTVIDSDPATWSHNSGSSYAGFVELRGVGSMLGGGLVLGADPGALSGISSGIWDTSEGVLTFTQTGTSVVGSYSQDNGKIDGAMIGNVLDGYWAESSSGQRCPTAHNGNYYWGKIRFVFSGTTFSGAWGYCSANPDHPWTGKKR